MSWVSPERIEDRQKIWVGTGLLALFGFVWLVPFSLGPFGMIWPMTLLWAAVGWVSFGPSLLCGFLLLLLGVWVDALCGAPIGAWAVVATATYGAGLLLTILAGRPDFYTYPTWIAGGGFFLVMIFVVGGMIGHWGAPINAALSVVGAVALGPIAARIFATERL